MDVRGNPDGLPYTGHEFEFDQLMIEQLLKYGFRPHFINSVDYDQAAWDSQGRPVKRVDGMVLDFPVEPVKRYSGGAEVNPAPYVVLYRDGVYDFHPGDPEKYGQLFNTGKGTYNPLGTTLAKFTTDQQAELKPFEWPSNKSPGHNLPPLPGPLLDDPIRWSVDFVEQSIKHIKRKLSTRRRTTRFKV